MYDPESVFSSRYFLRSNWVLITLLILLFTISSSIVRAADMPEAGDGHRRTFGPLQSAGFLSPRGKTALALEKQSFSLFTGRALDQTPVGDETWHSYPIYGGEMTSIAMDPSNAQTVYVGTRDSGIFKTIDGGQSWQPARTGLTFYPIRSLRIDPQHANTLYAGTDFDGIWKSTDSGNSWFKSSSGFDGHLIVFNIVIDPQNTNTLYAAIAGGTAFCIGNIYKSTDGGATWEKKDNGITRYSGAYTNAIFSLAIDPDNPLLVYAGTNLYGVFKSSNGGETWGAINDGLPFSISMPDYRETVNALAIDPHHSNRLSAIIQGKYFIYDNTGWQMVSDYTGTDTIFTDHLYFHPTDPSIIYGVGDRFAKTTDGGKNWLTYPRGASVPLGEVPDIAFHSASPDTIYAASAALFAYDVEGYAGGVYKSVDQGQTWALAPQGITATPIQSVTIDPRNSDNIYAASGDSFFYGSQDGGLTWSMGYHQTYKKDYAFCSGPNAIAVDPLDSQNIYVASDGGLFRSADQGKTFNPIDEVDGGPLSIAITPNASSPIYVGTLFGDGVYKSSDDGLTWVKKNQGLPLFGGELNPILSLAVDPNHPDTVWAGTQYGGGILKSIDGGEHWSVKGLTHENFVWTIAVRPDNSNVILAGAGFFDGNIYKSIDGGSSWQVKLSGIAFVTSIVFDPRTSRLVYASTEGGGILRSIDGGNTWHDYSIGIFCPNIYTLAITPSDSPRLIAGSYGSGLYWIDPSIPPAGKFPWFLFLPAITKGKH